MSSLSPTLFLALRYLRPRRTFVSVITIISVLGVTLGVMVLIVVIAVMSGFDRELRQKVLGLNSHLTITSGLPIRNWRETITQIEKRPHITGVAPFILGPVLARTNSSNEPGSARRVFTPYLKGIDPEREPQVSRLKECLIKGKWQLDENHILIGNELARRFGVFTGDKLTIYSPKNLEDRKVAYLPAEPSVGGIFESGMFEYDFGFVFCSIEAAQDLYDLGDSVHGISVTTDNLNHVAEVQKDLNKILRPPLRASTWMELNKRLFSAIAVEKSVMFFLLIFIIVVAAFGIMSTLITVTVQKRREIGILKSLGATPLNILSIFLTQGMIVGFIGTGLGLGAGLLLLKYRNEFLEFLRTYTGFEIFPREVYNFDLLPAYINPQDLLIICISAFLICSLAGLFPAWKAARLQSAEALRDF